MRFFNKYSKEENFRWIGFHIFKTTFGFGFSFGKPFWYIPYIEFILNDKNINNNTRKYFSISFGWLLFCFRIQILHGLLMSRYIKTRYVYRGKGKPLPYTGDIYE